MADYLEEAESLDKPNLILIEDEMLSGGTGIITNAYIHVILDGSMIKWNVTDGVNRNSVDDHNISFEDAERLIYTSFIIEGTADYHYDDSFQ